MTVTGPLNVRVDRTGEGDVEGWLAPAGDGLVADVGGLLVAELSDPVTARAPATPAVTITMAATSSAARAGVLRCGRLTGEVGATGAGRAEPHVRQYWAVSLLGCLQAGQSTLESTATISAPRRSCVVALKLPG
jgi:hypothetical protein